MIYLDDKADTCPDGLQGTPFWEVYCTLRQVAVAGVWPVDPGAYRAGMAWGWYALHKPGYLTNFRNVVQAALVSACAPMIKPTQTDAELVEYLRQWRDYRPTFPQLQSLYSLFGAVVDVQSISDPESQAVLPVDDTRLAFYLRVESVDTERPLSLSDAITIAVRATPIGSRPYAYYVQESRIAVPVALAPSGVTLWVENDTVASDPPSPALPPVTTLYLNPSHTAVEVVDTGLFGAGYTLYYENGDTYSESTIPMLGAAFGQNVQWSPSDVSNRFELVLRNNKVVLDGKGAYSSYVQRIEICADTDATVITVYDSSNTPYNAFKYTSDGTDYYYVLDGTQTDWTDDLASIGYHVTEYLDLIVGIVYSDGTWQSRTFGSNDYWYSGILSNDDKLRLKAFGLGATEPGGSFGPIGNVFYNSGLFEYEVKALYSDLGSTEIITVISNFFVRAGGSFSTSVFINSINAFSTPVMSWKLRVTKKTNS